MRIEPAHLRAMLTWAGEGAPWNDPGFAKGVQKSIVPIVEELQRLYALEEGPKAPIPGTLAAQLTERLETMKAPGMPTSLSLDLTPLVEAIRYHADKTAPRPRGRPPKKAE